MTKSGKYPLFQTKQQKKTKYQNIQNTMVKSTSKKSLSTNRESIRVLQEELAKEKLNHKNLQKELAEVKASLKKTLQAYDNLHQKYNNLFLKTANFYKQVKHTFYQINGKYNVINAKHVELMAKVYKIEMYHHVSADTFVSDLVEEPSVAIAPIEFDEIFDGCFQVAKDGGSIRL